MDYGVTIQLGKMVDGEGTVPSVLSLGFPNEEIAKAVFDAAKRAATVESVQPDSNAPRNKLVEQIPLIEAAVEQINKMKVINPLLTDHDIAISFFIRWKEAEAYTDMIVEG